MKYLKIFEKFDNFEEKGFDGYLLVDNKGEWILDLGRYDGNEYHETNNLDHMNIRQISKMDAKHISNKILNGKRYQSVKKQLEIFKNEYNELDSDMEQFTFKSKVELRGLSNFKSDSDNTLFMEEGGGYTMNNFNLDPNNFEFMPVFAGIMKRDLNI